MSSSTYGTLLRTPGAAAFFFTATVGRVGIAMTGLGLVWLVHGRTGSYTAAGLVTGSFAVAEAVVGPQVARLVDRLGQTRVLPPLLLAHAAAVAVLLALVNEGRPGWAMAAGGVLAGATIPQLGALSAARWSALLLRDHATALPTAFSLESLSNGFAFLLGPVLVSAVAANGRPALGTVLAAALIVVGGLALAGQRRTAPPPASGRAHQDRSDRSLLRPAFVVVFAVSLGIGAYFGAMQVSVTAFAVNSGQAGTAAPLYAVSSCTGLLAGWWYGRHQWRASPDVQLAVATSGLATGCLLLLTADSPLTLGIALAATGLAVPPILTLCSVLAERAVHRTVITQAFTWLNSASAAGAAGAAAISGRIVDTHGSHGGFAIAITAATTMTVVAAGLVRTRRRVGVAP